MNNNNLKLKLLFIGMIILLLGGGLGLYTLDMRNNQNGVDSILTGPNEHVCYYTTTKEECWTEPGQFSDLLLYTDHSIEAVLNFDPNDGQFNNNYEILSSISQYDRHWKLTGDQLIEDENSRLLVMAFQNGYSNELQEQAFIPISFYTQFTNIDSDTVTFSRIKPNGSESVDIGRYHMRFVNQSQPLTIQTHVGDLPIDSINYMTNTSEQHVTIKEIDFEFKDGHDVSDYLQLYKLVAGELKMVNQDTINLAPDEGIIVKLHEKKLNNFISPGETFDVIYSKNIEIIYEDEEGTEYKNYLNWKFDQESIPLWSKYDEFKQQIDK